MNDRLGRTRLRRRLVGLLCVLVLAFVGVGAKLSDLQVLRPTEYRELSHAQRVREQTLAADRGAILDRGGTELALSVPRQTIFVDPGLVGRLDEEAAALAAALDDDPERIAELMRRDTRFVYVARHVDDHLAEQVAALGIPSIGLIEEPERVNPGGVVGRSVVGLTDVDATGLSGVELAYDDLLTGTPGRLVFEQTAEGRTIPVGDHQHIPPVRGHDLVLTIDRALQFEAEQLLIDQVETVDAAGGVAIVSVPHTGEILAMANVTRNGAGTAVVDVNNQAVTAVYEPGSVMKVVPIAGAIDDGLVAPGMHLTVPDVIEVGGYRIDEHDYHGTVEWPVTMILRRSSNTGTVLVAQMLGEHRLYGHLRNFGFGEATALGFPDEQSGSVPAPDDWWGSSIGTIPIGQGVSATPLQMLLAYNTIATGGEYVPPRLVSDVIDADGRPVGQPVGDRRRVLDEETAAQLNVMLRSAVRSGTGGAAAVDGYTVAGKTGTSQKPQPGGGYHDDHGNLAYQASFAGFAPAEDPAVSILVVIDEPGPGHIFGGATAAPVFARLPEISLRRLDVPPPGVDRPGQLAGRVGDIDPAPAGDPVGAVDTGVAGERSVDRIRALPAGADPGDEPTPGGGGDPGGATAGGPTAGGAPDGAAEEGVASGGAVSDSGGEVADASSSDPGTG